MRNFYVALLSVVGTASLASQTLSVKSPDAKLELTFSVENTVGEQGCLFYSPSYKGKNVVLKSRLGILTVDLPYWINGFPLIRHTRQSIDEIWTPVYGERSTVKNR